MSVRKFTAAMAFSLLPGMSLASSDPNPLDLYDTKHWFEIYRNGDLVGEHQTRFEQNETGWTVSSDMKIEITFLGFTAYSFTYAAQEKWQNSELDMLEVRINDDGEKEEFTAERTPEGVTIKLLGEDIIHDSPLITTNHWKYKVVTQNEVLNTLTGNVNRVLIADMGWEQVPVANGEVKAKRYEYSGDLTDTTVWYDEQGRWIKLAFKARDGSDIEYLCQTCSQSPSFQSNQQSSAS